MQYTREEKQRLLELITSSGLPVKKACKHFGISDASFYAWRKQFAAEPAQEGNSRQENSPGDEAGEKLLALKRQHPYYGVVKLTKQLLRTHGLHITPRKAKRLLEEHGFQTEEAPSSGPPKGSRRFERLEPGELWMMDIMYYRLKKEGRFYLVSILDDYSRFIVAHRVCTTQSGDNIHRVFQEAVENYGLPKQLLTDRGSQFYSWKGINSFQELLANLGVEHILTRPQSPTTIGKIESFHRNIQKELLRQKEFFQIKEAAAAIQEYVEYYNFERVHMGIDYLVPSDRFFHAEQEVEKAITLPEEERMDFYLAGKIQGQPLRAIKDQKGRVTVYLAGQPVNVLPDAQGLKQALLPR